MQGEAGKDLWGWLGRMPAAIFVLVGGFYDHCNDAEEDVFCLFLSFSEKFSLDYWIVCQLPCWINIHHDDENDDQYDDEDDGVDDDDDDDDLDKTNVIGLTAAAVLDQDTSYRITQSCHYINIQYTWQG